MLINRNGPIRNILILTQYFWPESGAPQIRLHAMAKELGKLGVSVRVLTGMPNYPLGRIFDDYRGKLHQREDIDGIQVERVWLYPAAGRGSLKRLLNYVSFSVAVIPILIFGRRPDLVFVEAQPLILAYPAWMFKVLRRVPYIYNSPDLQVEISREGKWIGVGWLIGLAKSMEGFLMRHALSVTTVTHAFVDHFVEHRGVPRERASFLPNGADIDILRPLPRDNGYAHELGVGDRTVFTYAGTHAHYQGLEVIVEAAKLLADRKDIVILMVGQGPVREQLRQEVKDAGLTNILFRVSPFKDMPRLMSITYASLVVLKDMPAAKKMRLSKAIPPLACGVPLIYAGRGESAEIIQKESCGVVVEPERADMLAQAIRELAHNPGERDEMGKRGRALAESQFSWGFLVRDWFRQIDRIRAGENPDIPAAK